MPTLQQALNTNGDDGVKDTIHIAPGVLSEPAPYEILDPSDGDDLEIAGAGRDQTVVTTASTGNFVLLGLGTERTVRVRDMTLRIPASATDGAGLAAYVLIGILERVDVQSLNPGSDGVRFAVGGSYSEGTMYGSDGGSIGTGIRTNGSAPGALAVDEATFDRPGTGVEVACPGKALVLRRSRIVRPLSQGIRVAGGAYALVDNSVIEVGGAVKAISVGSAAAPEPTTATVRHVTITGTGTSSAARAVEADASIGTGR